MKMREHNLMGEERDPFKSGCAIIVCAANEFVLAVWNADKFGVTELLDDLLAMALRNDVFQFHAATLREGVGHPLTKAKIYSSISGVKGCSGELGLMN